MPLENEIINTDVQEVMNKPPGWLVSIGSTVVFAVVVLAIIILSFVKIPQTVSGPVSVFIKENNSEAIIEIKLPEVNLASIKPGMGLDIYLASYPSERFGFIKGKLGNISNTINSDKTFNARVVLQDSISTANKSIKLLNGMTGEGKVIVGYSSFIHNLFR